MQNITTEKAIKNQVASLKMEGFLFTEKELENVRKCLEGEVTFRQFKENLLRDVKKG